MFLQSKPALAADQVYFAATDNMTNVLVEKINAETVRIDMSAWYLTERAITQALVNRFNAGVQVRLIGDRGSIFEIDQRTRDEFYWLASQGIPIRLRYNPTWYPEIDHWKATIFAGQNLVAFGSGNYTPFELAPWSATNYKDEVFLVTDDQTLVKAFKTKFDTFWHDTAPEPESLIPSAPYFKNWDDACALESACSDYRTQYPNPRPMVINTARLEPDSPMPPDMVWGQGPDFNSRLSQEITNESTAIDFVIYRLTVDDITNALLARKQANVPIRIIVEPQEYLNRKWPEFWISHANFDKLWAAGIPMKQRAHDGLTHMKVLITSSIATVASSNYAAAWQRDHDYFVPASGKPAVHKAIKDRFQAMWTNTTDFVPFTPMPPDTPTLSTPSAGALSVPTNSPLVWNITTFATDYDVYVGTSQSNMVKVANVPAQLVNSPPATYSWTPSPALQGGTTYFWKVVARTFATPVNSSLSATSEVRSFTTSGSAGPPAAPTSPSPASGATGVSLSPTLTWSGTAGATFNVAFGTTNPPPQVATGLASASYQPGTLSPTTTYFWRVTAVTSGGSTAGSVWSFTTGSGGGGQPASDVVIYASDVPTLVGTWSKVSDATAAGGTKLRNADNAVDALPAPLASPSNYFETSFNANAGTQYRVWFRIHPIGDSKWNDSFYVQFSDSVSSAGSPVYRIGTTGGYTVNLWACATCQTSGWGWQRNAYWLADTGDVWFPTTGTHTLRVQVREDGAEIDQIVLSPVTYVTNAPGAASNDSTIVPKPGGTQPQPPAAPGSPSPASGATGVNTSTTLSWTAAGATSYDVKFGTTSSPPVVSNDQAAASYTPSGLAAGTTYFWQIVAQNTAGSTTGPVWTFTTASAASPPSAPASPTPANGATGVNTSTTLSWTATGATSYDVKFGTTSSPPVVSNDQAAASYTPSGLAAGTTYFWQIVAQNATGSTTGPVWTFTTASAASPPSAPASPNPANGATGVSLTPTLSWSSSGASAYDVKFGTTNPPPQVTSNQSAATYTPGSLTASTKYFWQIVARNGSGTTAGSVWSFTTAAAAPAPNVVIYGGDVTAANLHGSWAKATDSTSPGATKLVTTDAGYASADAPLAAPVHYFDVTFTAAANTPYHIWLRLQALNNSKYNDAVWVQFSDALSGGSPIYQLGTTSALLVNLATTSTATSLNKWGWQDGAYWLSQATTVTFAAAGTHTIRVQVREDGVQLDQIVLSPGTYLSSAPGSTTNDSTIVPKPWDPLESTCRHASLSIL